MKRTSVTATIVAFALLWMSTAPAFSQESEPAPPTLAETEKFINAHGVSDSTTIILPDDAKPEDRGRILSWDVRFEVTNCKAKSAYTYSINIVEGEQIAGDVKEMNATREQLSHTILESQGKKDWYSHVTPEYWLKLQYKSTNNLLMTVGYFDAVMGPRMKKAIDHWLDLCGGGPEPF